MDKKTNSNQNSKSSSKNFGFSRAEQDAQKDYEKLMKTTGNPSNSGYSPPKYEPKQSDADKKRDISTETDSKQSNKNSSLQKSSNKHLGFCRAEQDAQKDYEKSMKTVENPTNSEYSPPQYDSKQPRGEEKRDVSTTQYAKTSSGYSYKGNMQEAQKEYVAFMKSQGYGASAQRQDLRKDAERSGSSPDASVRAVVIDNAESIPKKEANAYTIPGPEIPKANAQSGNEHANQPVLTSNEAISEPQKFDLTKMHTSGTGVHKVAKLERLSLKASTVYLGSSAAYGSDVHRGYQIARDVYGTAALMIAENTRITLAKSIQKNASRKLSEYDKFLKEVGGEHMYLKYSIRGKITSQKDVLKMQRGINAILQRNYGMTIKGTGKVGWLNASLFLMKNQDKLSPEIKAIIKTAYKDAMSIQAYTRNGRLGRLTSLTKTLTRRISRYLRQSEAGYGAFLTFNILIRGRSLLRGALFSIRAASRVGYKTLVMAAKGMAWGAGKIAKHVPAHVKNAFNNNSFVKGAKSAGKTIVKSKNMIHSGAEHTLDRIRKFRRNPFGVKTKIRNLGKRVSDAAMKKLNKTFLKKPIKVGKKVFKVTGKVLRVPNIVASAIGRVFAAIASIVSAMISFLLIGIIAIVLILLLLSFLLNFIMTVISFFDFTAHEEEIVNAALNQIESCYEQQIDEINAMRGNYRNMTITYKDVRDDEAYEENEVTIAETTNSAEILSMATVYFDFDLEEAGKNKVTDYVKKLYNGSHQTSIATQTYNFTDEEGNPYTVTDANVTLTTYYFNSLFDCQLTDRYGTLSGTTTTMQIWNYFRSAGFSEESTAAIMGNFYQESGCDPTCIQGNGAGPAAGIAQWENINTQTGRWKLLYDYCAARGKDWTDLQCQLDYLIDEMPSEFNKYTGREPHVYDTGALAWWPEKVTADEFKAMTDIDTATELFERVYTRASKPNMARRIRQAHAYYEMYHGLNQADSPEMQARIDRAMSQLGKPYVWGAAGPDSFDCSGLVSYAITGRFEHTWGTADIAGWTKTNNPQPGDICIKRSGGSGHTGIYLGNNQMIHAPQTGDVVKISNVHSNMWFVTYSG